MAKPTDEIIHLPTDNCQLVRKVDGEFQVLDISLQQLQANNSDSEHADTEEKKGLIVYFYPRDNTSGCTTQAQDFSAMQQVFSDLGYAIVGISRDSVASHQKFIDKQALTIDLISDGDERLCQHFDVIKEKNMYGKKTLGLVRSTFVFDHQGNLTHAQRNLRAKGYAERLLKVLQG